MASLDVDKMGWSGILDMDTDLELLKKILTTVLRRTGNTFILGAFLVVLGLQRRPMGSQMYDVASLGVNKMGWSGK